MKRILEWWPAVVALLVAAFLIWFASGRDMRGIARRVGCAGIPPTAYFNDQCGDMLFDHHDIPDQTPGTARFWFWQWSDETGTAQWVVPGTCTRVPRDARDTFQWRCDLHEVAEGEQFPGTIVWTTGWTDGFDTLPLDQFQELCPRATGF